MGKGWIERRKATVRKKIKDYDGAQKNHPDNPDGLWSTWHREATYSVQQEFR
jgi:hypothetical protein